MQKKSEAYVIGKRQTTMNGYTCIVFLTKEWGKIEAFAKGLGKPTSRSVGLYEIGSHVHVEILDRKNGTGVITGISSAGNAHLSNTSFETLQSMWMIAEVVQTFVLIGGVRNDIFTLFGAYIDALSLTKDPHILTMGCILQLLQILGFFHADHVYPHDGEQEYRVHTLLGEQLDGDVALTTCSYIQMKTLYIASTWDLPSLAKVRVAEADMAVVFRFVEQFLQHIHGRKLLSFEG